MRVLALCLALWLVPHTSSAQLVRMQQPTNVAFGASDPNGMLVLDEHGGAAYDAGRYRFARLDRAADRVLGTVDVTVGPLRGDVLFGDPHALHVFHYALVPPGDYALIYLDSGGTNSVFYTSRWRCIPRTPIFSVGAGAITVVNVPDRANDIYASSGFVRRQFLRNFPEGTTFDYLYSAAKSEIDFSNVLAANPALTAPHIFGVTIGTLTFDAKTDARGDACTPWNAITITPVQ